MAVVTELALRVASPLTTHGDVKLTVSVVVIGAPARSTRPTVRLDVPKGAILLDDVEITPSVNTVAINAPILVLLTVPSLMGIGVKANVPPPSPMTTSMPKEPTADGVASGPTNTVYEPAVETVLATVCSAPPTISPFVVVNLMVVPTGKTLPWISPPMV